MNEQVSNTYKKVEKFFGEMLGRHEYLHAEIDFTLVDTRGGGYIYYPESINQLIRTKALRRMARIFQLGTNLYTLPNVYHTRLEHSKGTYYRTLELLQNLYDDDNIKSMITRKRYQKYILAELVRALLHDVGHGPFSHTMEAVCNLPKGFHEQIGIRLIKEDPELRETLNKIYPGLPEIYGETIKRNFLGLNRIFEGQVDLDRGDFLPRDSFFANSDYKETSRLVAKLFDNLTIEKIVDDSGKTKIVPVFAENQIESLDKFFMKRFNNYKNIYYNANARSYDYIFKAFAETLINNDESFKLKDFLTNNIDKKPEDIDLQEYIKFNDIEYLKGIIEVLDKTKNPTLKKLAIMSLPPKEKVQDFYLGLMVSKEQIDENGNREYTNESDEEFIKRLANLPDSKTEYKQNCLTLDVNNIKNINSVIKKLKLALKIKDEDLESLGIFSYNYTVTSYKNKKGEETYVKGRDGKIYEYSVHPERKLPIQKEEVHRILLISTYVRSKRI